MSKRKKKRRQVNSKNITKRIRTSFAILIILTILIIGLGYYIYGINILKLGINDRTANYISFNDIFDSDTIKINNVKRLSDKQGKKDKPVELNIKSDGETLEYEIILVPINVNVDYQYIKYYITDKDNNKLNYNNLASSNISDDYSGNVIYKGTINNKEKLKLRVWIDNNYKEDININSFEVKVKLK